MQIDPFSKAVAAILRRQYENSGLSYSAIAEQSGIARATVERVINGKREATAFYLHKLCEVFGTSPGAILDEAENAG